jgi:hypothetical protein
MEIETFFYVVEAKTNFGNKSHLDPIFPPHSLKLYIGKSLRKGKRFDGSDHF